MPPFDDDIDDLEWANENNGLYEHFHFVVDKGQELLRIDKYLTNCMSNISRNRIQEAADANTILVNNVPVKANYRVKPLEDRKSVV